MNESFDLTDLDLFANGPPHEIALSIGAFKAPSLRNVTVTAPYMHDGSLETLEDVLDHYSQRVVEKNHPSINFAFNGVPVQPFGPLRSFELSEEEKPPSSLFSRLSPTRRC